MSPRGSDMAAAEYVGSLLDQTRAELDPLTGLPNCAGLLRALDERRAAGLTTAVALLGMDNFRSVSVTLGASLADLMLQVVAARLLARLPADTIVARLDGDEFAIALPQDGHTPKAIEALLNAILLDLAQPCEVDMHQVHLDACVGLVLEQGDDATQPPDSADTVNDAQNYDQIAPVDSLEMIARAQLAMHYAKRGRGQLLRRFDPGMRTKAVDRRKLDLELRRAVRDGEFELHYQPQIDLATDRPTGAEALLRWRHPERGLLMPGSFIDALAVSSIANTMGWWILDRACRDAATWPLIEGRRMSVSVNLFPSQFGHEDFLGEVDAALRCSGLPAGCLELELTETIALRDDGAAAAALQALQKRGVRAAFDDFGTGYASLSMLHHLAVNRVKIDHSFVRDVMEDRGDAAIVRSILLIARTFNMQVTAEGVESKPQADFLRALGCDEVQGFLYSKALPVADFDSWLETYECERAVTGRRTGT